MCDARRLRSSVATLVLYGRSSRLRGGILIGAYVAVAFVFFQAGERV